MQLKILAIGKKMPDWVEQAIATYRKRLPREFHFSIVEIPQSSEPDADVRKRREGEKLISKLKPDNAAAQLVVALDVSGKAWSTHQLSQNMQQWQQQGQSVNFLIGGPDGLSSDCLDKASQQWSLSALTLPHPMVRVIVIEQLYRAHSILSGHPYHRA